MPTPTSILAALLECASSDPERPCIIWGDETISYGRLAAAIAAWANRYTRSGVVWSDRVGLYLDNTPAFLAAYFGVHLAGAAAVLINTQYRQIELNHMLRDSAPRVAVSDLACAPELRIALGQLHLAGIAVNQISTDGSLFGIPETGTIPTSSQLPQPSDLAILAYTSGTTGRAKGAMLTHANLVANSTAVVKAWHWTAADRLLLTLPLFHIHGLGVGVHGTLLAGASLDLHPHFDPDATLVALASGTVSMFFGVPTMYNRLIQSVQRQEQGNIEARIRANVRLFVSGSAALPSQLFQSFAETFGQQILERYGMTETVMNLTNPYRGERRPGTVGEPFPGQEARIVDIRSRQPLADGEIGEIQVRGPHVCAGYWRNAEATAEVFGVDGWFSTGDLGVRSPDGYFSITGRAKELIISGGYNIYPREVEERLVCHPAVAECAVRGMPDPDLGEEVVAWVVLHANAMSSDATVIEALKATLISFCREGIAAYKRPRKLIVVETLPRNALGKVQKHLLRIE